MAIASLSIANDNQIKLNFLTTADSINIMIIIPTVSFTCNVSAENNK